MSGYALADRSELGIGLDARYSAPISELNRSIDALGAEPPSLELKGLTQLGLTPQWTLGAGFAWGYAHQETDNFTDPSGVPCLEGQACRASSIVSTTHSGSLTLHLSYTPWDWLSPTIWGEVGAWRRSRSEAYETLSTGPSALIAHRYAQEVWWGHKLIVGGGLYWRFLSRWSTILGVQLQHEQVLTPSVPRSNHLTLGVSIWLNYHYYLRLF